MMWRRNNKPKKFQYVWVVTYGRSGSTLLQGILNTIPGYCIRGENNGVLIHLVRAVDAVAQGKQYSQAKSTPTHPWFGFELCDPASFAHRVQSLFVQDILRPPVGTRVMGCKEIRWGADLKDWQISSHLDMIERVFPHSAFIFNERDIAQTSRSAWWKDAPNAVGHLTEFRNSMLQAYERNRPNYFWVSYDAYRSNPSVLTGLFRFLNEDFDSQRVSAAMKIRHSYV
jgi:hypothetical protein